MIKYSMTNVDQRKRDIVALMAGAPNAEEISPRDRTMIADLIYAGLEKVLATLDAHLDAVVPALSSETAARALVLLQVIELESMCAELARQMALNMDGTELSTEDLLSELDKVMEVMGMDPDDVPEFVKQLRKVAR